MKKLFLFLAAYAMMLPVTINAQPQIKENIEEIKNKINGFTGSLAEIKANTNGLAEMMKNIKSKSEVFSPDMFSGDNFERLKEAMTEFKNKVTAETGAIRKFRGADLKCGPGSECFKFKKDIADVFNGTENLKRALIGQGLNLNMAEKLGEIIEQSPGFGLYPLYATIGPWVTTLSKNLNDMAKNVESIMAYAKEAGTGPELIFKGIGPRHYDKGSFLIYTGITTPSFADNYIEGFEIKDSYIGLSSEYVHPDNAIDSNITTIELSKLCSKDRKALGFTINATRESLKIVAIAAKVMGEQPDKEFQLGGSFVGHVTTSLKINSTKKLSVFIEGLTDAVDQLLDFASGNMDKCDDLRAQKMIADNQKLIMENQKLIYQMLANLQSNQGNPGNSEH